MGGLAITGSTGALGGRVARLLAKRGIPQRLIVSDPERAPKLEGAEPVAGSDYGDEAGMQAALTGAKTLYFVSGREDANRLEQHWTVVRAAEAAGVEHVVYTSFLSAAPDATFTLARHHWATEEAIREAGLGHTFLRSGMYLDYMPFFAGPEGVIGGPAGEGRFAPVSRDDLAAAAAAVLSDPRAFDGQTFELTGPELLTLGDVAERLSAIGDRAITYVPETVEEAWASRRPSGAPDWEIEGWVTSYEAIADGSLEILTEDVERLTGARPQTLEQCLAAHPELLG